MSSEWDETCLVCGIKTKHRCSKCAEAGISLYFCSPDHQKLVWKAHRQVCGPGKANPFLYPLLSKDEADQILEHMHDSIAQLAHHLKETSTIAKALQHFLQVPGRQLRSCINEVTQGGPTERITHEMQQLVLVIVRAQEHGRTHPLTLSPTVPAVSYIDYLAQWDWYSARDVQDSSTTPFGKEPWRAWYRHSMLVYLLLMDAGRRDPSLWPTISPWLGRLRERNHAFIRTTVAATSPRLAASLIGDVVAHQNGMRSIGLPTLLV